MEHHNIGLKHDAENTIGYNNTSIGVNSLIANTTGVNNTGVGKNAGNSITVGTNLTMVGYDADASAVDATNEITLGNANVATLRCNTQSISALSDVRDKTNVQGLNIGLNFIDKLNPVTFDWNRHDGTMHGEKGVGFIAQELDSTQKEFKIEDNLNIVLKSNPEKLEAAQGKLIPVLVKAIQELSAEVKELKGKIKDK